MKVPASVNADAIAAAMNAVFDNVTLPEGFLGLFYGLQHENPETLMVVTKWATSKGVINNDSWLRESENRLQSILQGKAQIQSRRQMYA